MASALAQWLSVAHPSVLEEFTKTHPSDDFGGAPPAHLDPAWQPPKNAPWQDPNGVDVRPLDPTTGQRINAHDDGRPITARDPHPNSPKHTKPASSPMGAPPATSADREVQKDDDGGLEKPAKRR